MEPLHDADRLVFGGSLYPPPGPPVQYTRHWFRIIVGLAVTAWAIVVLMVYPVLM